MKRPSPRRLLLATGALASLGGAAGCDRPVTRVGSVAHVPDDAAFTSGAAPLPADGTAESRGSPEPGDAKPYARPSFVGNAMPPPRPIGRGDAAAPRDAGPVTVEDVRKAVDGGRVFRAGAGDDSTHTPR